MKDERGKAIVSSKWKVGILVLVLVFWLNACASGEGIEAHEVWVRTALQGENSAFYLILHNHTAHDDTLIRVSADVASAIELHSTGITNDVMQMRQVEVVEILADSEVEFKSGGFHIMLIGLKQDLRVGDEIMITFHFENYQDVTVTVPVRDSAGEHPRHP